MNKSEFKIALYDQLGTEIDDMREASLRECGEASGAVTGLGDAITILKNGFSLVDADIGQESIDLATAQYAKRILQAVLIQMTDKQALLFRTSVSAQGKLDAYVRMVRHMADKRRLELAQLEHQRAAERPVGTPQDLVSEGSRAAPMSLKERRQLEDAAETPGEAAVSVVEDEPTPRKRRARGRDT